jgi:hypothetical protein
LKLTYYSLVREGKLQKNISLQIKNELNHFEGKRVEITIQKLSAKRSDQQNRLWWLYMGILSKELGFTKEEIHDICKFKFLKREKVDEKSGEIFEYLGSTTQLNKMEFADMVSELIRWVSETFDIVLPLPDEQMEIL